MLQKIIDDQYRRPAGLLGRYIGARMARAHRPENMWTVSVLAAQPADHILELGFGAGLAIQELSRLVTQGRIVGLDFSPTMVRAARRRNAAAIKQGRVELHHGEVTDLPFADHTFDKAFSIHSIYFWPQPRLALTGLWRVLKPGGTLTLTILPKALWNAADPTAPVGTPNCTPYSGEELADLLTAAGFQHSHIKSDANPEYRSNFCVVGVK